MTVANTNVSSSYNCNGVTREFNIGFHYNSTLSGLSIVVLHADGTSTTVTANYEIEDNVLTYPTIESELDPLPEGDVITISRVTPLTQSINLVQQGPLDADVLEGGYDKATLQIQEVASKKQDKLIAGENIVIDEDGTISATGELVEGVNWGNIHGTLSNQTDLLTALNAKADGSDLNSYVAKTGSTMSGNLTMSNGSRAILSNTSNSSYNVFAHETSGGVKQLHLTDTTTGTGVLLDAANSNKPFYVDGSNAYRLLDTSDKTTLETSISSKADTDMGNVSANGKATAIGWGMPDYSAGIQITGSASFTCPSAGFVTIQPIGGTSGIVYVNGNRVGIGSNSGADASVNFIVSKNDVITIKSGYSFGTESYFYPLKGAN